MKRVILCFAVGGILATITLCVSASSPGSTGDASEIEQLKEEVEALRRRVESLEKRLEDRALVIPRGRALPPMTIDPNSLPGFRSVPRDWRRFEFNGMPFYVIPIEGAACPGAQPGK